jgi:hypothetical protein
MMFIIILGELMWPTLKLLACPITTSLEAARQGFAERVATYRRKYPEPKSPCLCSHNHYLRKPHPDPNMSDVCPKSSEEAKTYCCKQLAAT